MPELVASLEGTIARAGAQLGAWWPNPWWPTGNSSYNDCAAFVSWCLWGLNGRQPYQTIVSGVIERSGLEFHAGAAGIRRGDVAGFRWTLADNYDHTELVLSSPSALGMIQTIGANGGGSDKVAIHTRSTGYVHNYARPAYQGTVTAGGTTGVIVNQGTETDMYCIGLDQGKSTAVSFSVGIGILQRHSQERQQELAAAQAQQPGGCYWYGDDDFARTMWNHGLGEFTVAQARALTDNGHLIAKAVYGTGAAVTLTDAQLAKIADGVKAPAPDLSSVLTAIAALDKQDDDYEAKLETLIRQGLTGTITISPKG